MCSLSYSSAALDSLLPDDSASDSSISTLSSNISSFDQNKNQSNRAEVPVHQKSSGILKKFCFRSPKSVQSAKTSTYPSAYEIHDASSVGIAESGILRKFCFRSPKSVQSAKTSTYSSAYEFHDVSSVGIAESQEDVPTISDGTEEPKKKARWCKSRFTIVTRLTLDLKLKLK